MRVLYDGMIYSMQAAGGINRYFANLIRHLPACVRPCLLVQREGELNYPTHPNLRTISMENVGRRFQFRPGRLARRLEATYYQSLDHPRHTDLAHPTFFSLLTGQTVEDYRCPVVLTVYDMIHELFPQHLDPHGHETARKRRAVAAASTVICISENTKRDLMEWYHVPEHKIHVTHLATDLSSDQSYGPAPVPEQPYFLYVGSRSAYKNFGGLLSAFARASSARPGMHLCVVGASFSESEQEEIAALGVTPKVLHYGQVADDQLAKLYRCSLGLVYPSLYEGFGIPPLEAMSCGTVAVAADTSSIPEVVGDAGLLFDPRRPDGLVDILLTLFDQPSVRADYIARGGERVKMFTWSKTAEQTLAVYRSVS